MTVPVTNLWVVEAVRESAMKYSLKAANETEELELTSKKIYWGKKNALLGWKRLAKGLNLNWIEKEFA